MSSYTPLSCRCIRTHLCDAELVAIQILSLVTQEYARKEGNITKVNYALRRVL